MTAPSGREPLALPDTLRLRLKLCHHAKGPISEDDFPRPGEDVAQRQKGKSVAVGDWGSFSVYPLRHGLRRASSPKGTPLALPQTLPLLLKPSPWGRWIAAKRQDGRGNAAIFPSDPSCEKKRLTRSAERVRREIINNLSAEHGQSTAEAILNRAAPGRGEGTKNSPLRGSLHGVPRFERSTDSVFLFALTVQHPANGKQQHTAASQHRHGPVQLTGLG